MADISVTVLTKNSQKYILDCLESLSEFDEIVVLDNGSTDDTLDIVSTFENVRVFKSSLVGLGTLKNLAAGHAKNDWILNIDSDEIVSKELSKEITRLELDRNVSYDMPRHNHYNEKLVKCCGWYPDRIIRLYNKHTTFFSGGYVHSSIVTDNISKVVHLKHPILHFPYNNASQLIEKMHLYSRFFAMEHRGKRKSFPAKAFFHAGFCFLKNYFLQRGFLCGYLGFLISVSNANGVFYKYIMLYEENRNR